MTTYTCTEPFTVQGFYFHTDGSVAWYFRNPSGQIERGRVFATLAEHHEEDAKAERDWAERRAARFEQEELESPALSRLAQGVLDAFGCRIPPSAGWVPFCDFQIKATDHIAQIHVAIDDRHVSPQQVKTALSKYFGGTWALEEWIAVSGPRRTGIFVGSP